MSQEPTETGMPSKDRERQLSALIGLSDRFGDSLSRAFAKNLAEGRKLDDMLKGMGRSLLESGLKQALSGLHSALSQALKGLLSGLGGGASGGSGLSGAGLGEALGSLFGAMPALAQGGVVSRGMIMPFAQGGVVAAPTYFPLGRGLGLMGEQGAEAVMPLARGPDGRLGVRGGGGGRPVSVTVNIATPDAEGFRRSEAQVSAALARAVARGQRAT
jgi:lambda family phage tail tape measure protein